MTALVEVPEVDLFAGASLDTVFGRQVLSGTPFETLLGRIEAQMTREVLWRAGRPGMCTVGVHSSTTEYGNLGGFGIPGGYDADFNAAVVLQPSEMKTTYASLHKVVQAHNCGAKLLSGSHSYVGGYAGTAEATAICTIASGLLQRAVHWCHFGNEITCDDLRYVGSCGREAQWAVGIALQAVSRNTHSLRNAIITELAGPCTKMLLYEITVGMMNICVSGSCLTTAPRSAGGKYTDYLTPLEVKFCGEVYKACAGMTRAQANEIAKLIIPRYEKELSNPPKGKSVRECFDLKTSQPSPEWLDIYIEVKKELIELGIPLNPDN
jgi:methylamine--corrinoid protein Co-methyltransferase